MKKIVLAIAASAALSVSAPAVTYAETTEGARTAARDAYSKLLAGALAFAAIIAVGNSGSSSAPASTTTTTTTTTTN